MITEDNSVGPGQELNEVKPLTVEFDARRATYVISGKKEELIELGIRLYDALSTQGEGLSPEVCRESLGKRRELRPRSGIYAININVWGQLEVENRNMPRDTEVNEKLKLVVEKETS
ncbi:MAG: hypothetical protein V1846_03050 [Candidatus Komeilibacteria bacterium]